MDTMDDLAINVLGGVLQPCSMKPLTGCGGSVMGRLTTPTCSPAAPANS